MQRWSFWRSPESPLQIVSNRRTTGRSALTLGPFGPAPPPPPPPNEVHAPTPLPTPGGRCLLRVPHQPQHWSGGGLPYRLMRHQLGGHKATVTELAFTPMSQAYGHRLVGGGGGAMTCGAASKLMAGNTVLIVIWDAHDKD